MDEVEASSQEKNAPKESGEIDIVDDYGRYAGLQFVHLRVSRFDRFVLSLVLTLFQFACYRLLVYFGKSPK